MTSLTPQDLVALERAVQLLEHPGLGELISRVLGHPIQLIGRALPPAVFRTIRAASVKSIEAALRVALRTMGRKPSARPRLLHNALASASGAAGGAFGLATLPIELPVSTIIMLRAIAEIARREGEDLSDPEAALACVEVFALGGHAGAVVPPEGYFAIRSVLTKSMTDATRYIAARGLIEGGRPLLVRFITQVAARFGTIVTMKVAAQTLPAIGALGGATVNYLFINYFQNVAQGHFTIRRLERAYGADAVRSEYERIAKKYRL